MLDAAEDALRAGTKGLCVISAGFAEIGAEGVRAAAAAPGGRARTRRASRRSELPRHRRHAAESQCDVRPAGVPCRQCRPFVAERSARPRIAGGCRRPGNRRLRIRLHRQQGGRLVERPPGVLGRRSGHGGRSPLPRVVRQSEEVRPPCTEGRAQEADPRTEGWPHGCGRPRHAIAHGCPRRLGNRRRRALLPGRGHPRRHARGARGRRRSALQSASAPRSPRRAAHERRRTRHPCSRRV